MHSVFAPIVSTVTIVFNANQFSDQRAQFMLNCNGVQFIAFRQEVMILTNSTAKLQKKKSDYF